jgi:hypothetical protein
MGVSVRICGRWRSAAREMLTKSVGWRQSSVASRLKNFEQFSDAGRHAAQALHVVFEE